GASCGETAGGTSGGTGGGTGRGTGRCAVLINRRPVGLAFDRVHDLLRGPQADALGDGIVGPQVADVGVSHTVDALAIGGVGGITLVGEVTPVGGTGVDVVIRTHQLGAVPGEDL